MNATESTLRDRVTKHSEEYESFFWRQLPNDYSQVSRVGGSIATAVPPDVRRWLGPAVTAAISFRGYAPGSAFGLLVHLRAETEPWAQPRTNSPLTGGA